MNMMPPVTKNLLIINVLCFFASYVLGLRGIDLNDLFGLHFVLAEAFRPWQFFTYMFMHGGLQHLFFNMFALWMFGRIIEQTLGVRRFLFYYLTCGLGAGLAQELVQGAEFLYYGFAGYEQISIDHGMVIPMSQYLNQWCTVGASGCVYGILLAFGMTFPNERMFIFPLPVPIKAKYFVMGYAVIELLSAMAQRGDGVAHMAHLGGMLVGLLLLLYWRGGGGSRSRRGNFSNYDRGTNTWDNLRRWFASIGKKRKPHINVTYGGRYSQDAAYLQKKKENEEELNRILDKVKKNGYSGLSEEEKKRLFDISRR